MKKSLIMVAGVLTAFAGWTADVTINVPEGVTQDFYTALEANGYQKSDLKGQRIVKTGLGVLIGTNDLGSTDGAYFDRTLVQQGVYVVRSYSYFGWMGAYHADAITVANGATLRLAGTGFQFVNQCVTLAGSGAEGEGGAIVCDGYGEASYAQYKLSDDTTFRANQAGDYALCFEKGSFKDLSTQMSLNGHDLTLTAKGTGSRYGFRLSKAFSLKGTGRVIVDGTYFGQGAETVQNYTPAGTRGYVTLVLKNGATYRPRSQEVVSFFSALDAEAGTTIAAGEDSSEPFAMSIGDLLGAPTATSLTSLTVTDSLTVRVADLKNGNRLSVDGDLIFDGTVPLTIVGDPAELSLAENRIKIAVSDTGVTGLPVLTSPKLLRHWSVEKGADDRSVELVYDPSLPAGVIDVRTWGVLPGADAAEANTTRFNATLASLEDANPILYFAEGDYYFSDALQIARDNVVLTGEGEDAVLHLASGSSATSLVRITGANDAITGIVIADTTGPGVFISGASNAAVTNAFFTGVAGTYPVEAENSTLTCVRDNRFQDGATYTALAHHTNGTQAEDSEPIQNYGKDAQDVIRLTVDASESETVTEAFAKSGHTTLTGCHLTKVGPGTLVGVASSTFIGLTVKEGVFEATENGCFGQIKYGDGDQIIVSDGGTLRIAGTANRGIANRKVYLAGSGAPGQGGALVWAGSCGAFYPQYHLDADAVMAAAYDGGLSKALYSDDTKNPAVVTLYGHDLKLVSTGSGQGFQWSQVFKLYGSGSVTVDGTSLSQVSTAFAPTKTADAAVTLRLRNGAVFSTPTTNSLSFFNAVDCDATSSVSGTGTAFDWVVPSWVGCGTVDAGISSLTISKALTVRSDELNAGAALSVAGRLAFGTLAAMSIDGAEQLTAGSTGRRTICTAGTSLDGCPVLLPTRANRNWKVASGAVSAELVYTPSKPTDAIDVCADWGILEGAENAAANAQNFNAGVAALAGSATLFVPKGTYVFDAPLVIAKDGVTLVGDAEESILKASADFEAASLLTVSGGQVTISGLLMEGTTGPAIAANQTATLVVTNNSFRSVGGVIADVDGTYPVSVADGTGTRVRDNLVLDGATYAEAVYLDGGTKDAAGEPLTSEVRIRVDAGEELGLDAAFARTGRASYPALVRLVKTGGGTLLGSVGYSSFSSSIKGITVEQGIYSVTGDHFGVHDWNVADQVKVKDGATLLLAASSTCMLNNRACHLEGSGAPGMGGAIVMTAEGFCRYAQFTLTGDATMMTKGENSYAKCFYPLVDSTYHLSAVKLAGHTLTLAAAFAGKGFALSDCFEISSAGTILVSGTTLAQSSDVVTAKGKRARLVLKDGARFLPRSQDVVDLFSVIEADATSSVVGGDGDAADFALTVGGWSGAGSVSTGFTALAVTNSFETYAADILAGRYATMACPVTLTSNVRLRLADPDGLMAAQNPLGARYTCAASAVSWAGKPGKDRASDYLKWKPVLPDAQSLGIETFVGLMMIVR